MKVIFSKERVINGINRAIAVMPSKIGTPALQTLWIKAADNMITLSATDANIEFTGSYPADVVEPGFIGLQGHILRGILSTLSGTVELSAREGDSTALMTHAAGVCKLPIMTLNWFEEMKPYPDTPPVYWYGETIKEVIDKISFCINDLASNIDALACLYIARNNDKIDVCGLNGHLFAMYSLIHEEMQQYLPQDGVLIQKTHLPQLNKWLTNDDIIELKFSDSFVFFKNSNNEILTIPRVMNLTYPEYMNFINRIEQGYSTLRVQKNDLLHSLNRILTVNTVTDSCTDLYISEDKKFIDCSANIENTGDVIEHIGISYDGDIRKISFRTKDLLSVINHFDSSEIKLALTTDVGPCRFTGDDDPFYLAILMPVQTIEKTYSDKVEKK